MNSSRASPSAGELGDERSGQNRAFFVVRRPFWAVGRAAWRARQPASWLGALLVAGLQVGWLTADGLVGKQARWAARRAALLVACEGGIPDV